jgi:hypothetical protein
MTEENIKRMALEAGFSDGEVDYIQSIIIHFATLVAQQEREACAKIADIAEPYKSADLIRARGQA